MKTFLRSLSTVGAALALATAVQAKIERTVERTFNVTGAGLLRLETTGGEIRVTTGGDATVKVTARQRFRTSNEAEADEVLKKLELSIEQSGNDVTAVAKYSKSGWGSGWGSWPPVSVDLLVTVPASYAADVRTSGGAIQIGDLAGKIKARTSGGPISLGKMGAPVDAHTSGGSINLESAKGEVSLHTSGGNISVGRIDGEADLATSGGSIKVESVFNSLKARTSGGSINATIAGPLKADSSLTTSGGGIRVRVDPAAAFRLDAATSGGGVDATGLTLTLEKPTSSRSRLAGAVNGGGPVLKLRTSGGGISIRTQ